MLGVRYKFLGTMASGHCLPYIYKCMCVYIHTHIYIYMCIHIYIYNFSLRSSWCFALASCKIIGYLMIVAMLLKFHYGGKCVACLTGWFSKKYIVSLCRRPWFESRLGKLFALLDVHKNSKIMYM